MTPDDPRLTAYLHGELTDPADRKAVAQALAENPALAREAEEIRAVEGLLRDALQSEPQPAIAPAPPTEVQLPVTPEPKTSESEPPQHEPNAPDAEAPPPEAQPTDPAQPPLRFPRWLPLAGISTALAASLALVVGLTILEVEPEEPVVLTDTEEYAAGNNNPLRNQNLTEVNHDQTHLNPPPPPAQADNYVQAPTEGAAQRTQPGTGLASTLPPPQSKEMTLNRRDSDTIALAQPTMEAAYASRPRHGFLPPPVLPEPAPLPPEINREGYAFLTENAFRTVREDPLSTFSIDVDTASFTNVRRYLDNGRLPPAGAVRVEELVNYFPYDDPTPESTDEPFTVNLEVATAPWQPDHALLRIALKGYEVDWSERPAANLVFLVDISGSMNRPNKLPLVQEGLRHLTRQLDGQDTVAIVTYAGQAGLALPSTTANNTATILHAIDNLRSGGSTHGSAGINKAYELAREAFRDDGINRVILCTDGDFNVGTTSRDALVRLIQKEADSGVFLSVYGFGMGNLQDETLELLSQHGNGNYAYIDNQREARRAFVDRALGSLMTIASDVKIQVEFNPAAIASYRLLGYENRLMANADFADDQKDAGEIGAGHSVVALYEFVPVENEQEPGEFAELRYQETPGLSPRGRTGELLTVALRYKHPGQAQSILREFPLRERLPRQQNTDTLAGTSDDFRFSAAVAAFGMILRDSPAKGQADYQLVRDLARNALGQDPGGYRSEFLGLVDRAESLTSRHPTRRTEKGSPSDPEE